jgi:hypothetical protein
LNASAKALVSKAGFTGFSGNDRALPEPRSEEIGGQE